VFRAARKWWQRGLAAAEESGGRFEAARIYAEMGRQMGSRPFMERSEEILESIGSRFRTEG